MSQPRVFLDSCVLVEGLAAPWSASRGVLILGRSMRFTFVLAEVVLDETERALAAKFGDDYGGAQLIKYDLALLLQRVKVERVSHISQQEFRAARAWIRHFNDVAVLGAAVKARPDWLLTNNTNHFDNDVSKRTGLRIATPAELLIQFGRIL